MHHRKYGISDDNYSDTHRDKDNGNDKDNMLKRHAIFSKNREFKDIRYDTYNYKDNDKDKDSTYAIFLKRKAYKDRGCSHITSAKVGGS